MSTSRPANTRSSVSHYPKNEYEGYEFSTSEWKNTDNGRFLVLRYTRRDNGEILYRGFMRRTIRNGYEIDFDMQIYGRSTTNKDNTNLNKIWETFTFVEVLPRRPRPAPRSIFPTFLRPKPTSRNLKSRAPRPKA